MNIFISADIEGIAGVITAEQCRSGNPEYQEARALMEQEVNAAISGAFDAGATKVVVADSHGGMTNLRSAYIDPRAELIVGKPRSFSMVEGIEQDEFDGLLMIGYHSAAGQAGVLAHTINSSVFYNVVVNGYVMSEADLYAAAAGEYNTPLLLVSGDDQLEGWVEKRYPGVSYCCVKRAISTTSAQSLSPENARYKIKESTFHAIKTLTKAKLPLITAPFELELSTTKSAMADVLSLIPEVELSGPRTVKYTAKDMKSLISLLCAFSYLGSTQL